MEPIFLGAVKMLHIQTEKQRIGETEDPFATRTAMLRFFIEKVLFVHLELECPISNRGFLFKNSHMPACSRFIQILLHFRALL